MIDNEAARYNQPANCYGNSRKTKKQNKIEFIHLKIHPSKNAVINAAKKYKVKLNINKFD